ncbi:hypothetical protein H0H92_006888, partial [Tricholoma furcatifolium]
MRTRLLTVYVIQTRLLTSMDQAVGKVVSVPIIEQNIMTSDAPTADQKLSTTNSRIVNRTCLDETHLSSVETREESVDRVLLENYGDEMETSEEESDSSEGHGPEEDEDNSETEEEDSTSGDEDEGHAPPESRDDAPPGNLQRIVPEVPNPRPRKRRRAERDPSIDVHHFLDLEAEVSGVEDDSDEGSDL